MRVLLDECVPRKLKFMFIAAGYDCETAREAGFGGMTNGKLLAQAELLFDVLVTIDRNIRHQQNLAERNIAILVLCVFSNEAISSRSFPMRFAHSNRSSRVSWWR